MGVGVEVGVGVGVVVGVRVILGVEGPPKAARKVCLESVATAVCAGRQILEIAVSSAADRVKDASARSASMCSLFTPCAHTL